MQFFHTIHHCHSDSLSSLKCPINQNTNANLRLWPSPKSTIWQSSTLAVFQVCQSFLKPCRCETGYQTLIHTGSVWSWSHNTIEWLSFKNNFSLHVFTPPNSQTRDSELWHLQKWNCTAHQKTKNNNPLSMTDVSFFVSFPASEETDSTRPLTVCGSDISGRFLIRADLVLQSPLCGAGRCIKMMWFISACLA